MWLSAASTPLHTLIVAHPYVLAIAGNNLVVSNFSGFHIYEYSLPLTGTSTPVLTLARQRSSNVQALPIGRAPAR